jgi:ankyrin repeat protein
MFRIAVALVFFLGSNTIAFAEPLHDAAHDGDVEKVSGLIDEGVAMDVLSDNGETPLNLAILGGQLAVVDLLIEKGADFRARNSGGFTALHAAAYVGDVDTASKLLGKGANVNDQENKAEVTPLSVAAEEGHVEMARVLVEHGADLEAVERNGYTPLSRALWRDQKEVVSLLHESGAACQPIGILGKAVHSRCVAGTP